MTTHGFIVFDCDGTLVDTQAAIIAATKAAFADAGIEIAAHLNLQRLIGLPLEEVVSRIAPTLDKSEISVMADRYRAHYDLLSKDVTYESRLFTGIEEVVMDLRHAGNLIGIVTGKSRPGLYQVLDANGIFDLFDVLKTSEDGPGKPNPSLLLDAIRDTGSAASRTVMIGDTSFDMEMAVRANVMPLGVAWGYHEASELRQSGAINVADSAGEILAHVDTMMRTAHG